MSCAGMPVLSAGPQKARVFGRFPSETCVFPRCGGPPGAEVPCFHAPSDAARRHGETHGFSGVFGGQKTPVFHGPRAQRPKNHVFLRSNSTPPRGPLSGGRCGTGVRDTTRKRQFPAEKRGFTTAPSPPRGENPVFSRPSPTRAGPSRASRGPIRPACARDSALPAQIHRVLPRELARPEPRPGTGPLERKNTGVSPGAGQTARVFAGAAAPDKRAEPAQ